MPFQGPCHGESGSAWDDLAEARIFGEMGSFPRSPVSFFEEQKLLDEQWAGSWSAP